MRNGFAALGFAALALSSGCYLSFGLSDDPDASVRDAALVTDAALARDAGAARDLGAVDAGLLCPSVRADFLCLESFLVPPDRAFTLPLSFATCGCCPPTECAVAVDVAAQVLRVTTTLCADRCDCDSCNAPTAECIVPPLRAGFWRVDVNGSAALTLPVMEDSGFVAPPPACVHFAEPSSCEGDIGVPGFARRASLVCATPTASPDTYVLELTDECGGCALESTCTVRLQARFTDDLPSGGDLFVESLQYSESCTDCLEECTMTTRRCEVPPLVAGDFYRVFVEGVEPVEGLTFVADGSETTCSGVRTD